VFIIVCHIGINEPVFALNWIAPQLIPAPSKLPPVIPKLFGYSVCVSYFEVKFNYRK